jgi:dsDNA-specific endonuclease/ATPase MutS2
LRLHGARHPLLLQRGDGIVPLDVALGDPHHLLVVTGPEHGGKTVVLKTIGLLACMAVSGLPIPAKVGAQIPFFRAVQVDIGDEQAINEEPLRPSVPTCSASHAASAMRRRTCSGAARRTRRRHRLA